MAQWFMKIPYVNDIGPKTLNTHIPSFTLLVVCIYQLLGHRLQYFLKKQQQQQQKQKKNNNIVFTF